MNYAPKHLFVAGLLATLSLAAAAQTPPATPLAGPPLMLRDGHRHADPAKSQERLARMQERMARHFAEFKQKLHLSAGQEAAWNNYMAALKPANLQRPDRAEMAKLTTPERIDRMRALRTERMAAMDQRGEATKIFYASLTPEQKKLFDAETASRGRHGPGGHHGGHHRG